jgi:dipeptidyl aminopeptidase/acylaminoacyl peptidase
MQIKSYLIGLVYCLSVLLTGCGGGDGSTGDGDNPPDLNNSGPQLTGVIVFEQAYEVLGSKDSYGIMEYRVATDELVHFHDGESPRRHPGGSKTALLQACGEIGFIAVHRVLIVDAQGNELHSLPCSGDVSNPDNRTTRFGQAELSPNEDLVAVEAYYYIDNGYKFYTVIYDLAGNIVYSWLGGYDPTWTQDGRLLMATTGNRFFLTDQTLMTGENIDPGQFSSTLLQPDIHPDGDRFIFSYNSQIWSMNLDGTGLTRLVEDAAQLRTPAWSPDGRAFVFTAWHNSDSVVDSEKALYFYDMQEQQLYMLNLQGRLSTLGEPWGPLSWTP